MLQRIVYLLSMLSVIGFISCNTISGTVTKNRAGLPGVIVVLETTPLNEAGYEMRIAITNSNGKYSFLYVANGYVELKFYYPNHEFFLNYSSSTGSLYDLLDASNDSINLILNYSAVEED